MCDPSTGLSRGYGFVRFADESDMQRALLLGQNAGSGLSLHGRTLRISEASGPGNNANGEFRERERTRTRSGEAGGAPNGLSIQTPYSSFQSHDLTSPPLGHHGGYPDFLSPTFPTPYTPGPLSPASPYGNPLSPTLGGPGGRMSRGPLSPGFGGSNGGGGGASNHSTDPNNTTVFVGGLPACISEETLKVRS